MDQSERAFYKAHTELLKSQKQRGNPEIGFEWKKVEAAAEAQPELPKKQPKHCSIHRQNRKKNATPAPVEPDAMSIDDKLRRIMNAGLEEMRASGL